MSDSYATLGPEDLNDPIAEHVSREFAVLREDATVGEALAQLRQSQLAERIVYFYATDQDNRLVGVVPTRRLLMSRLDNTISAIMVREVLTIPASATVLEACERFARHKFLAFPVVDDEGRMIGVVDINLFTEETITEVQQSQAERAFQLIGVHVALGRRVSAFRSFQDRFPWLLCNVAGGILCAVLASRYELVIEAVIAIALFIPVVLALAESVSMQSMALTLEGLEHRRMHWPRVWGNLRKEFLAAVLLGLGCGATVGAVALVWRGELIVAVAIAVSILLAMVTACLLGVAVPTLIRAVQFNPRIAAGPIVLASADVATLGYYFNLCAWLL